MFTSQEIQELQEGLSQFYGTDCYHRASSFAPFMLMTDGVKFLAQKAKCFWLIDAICSYQPKALRNQRLREFQVWKLKVDLKKREAVLTGLDDTIQVFRQTIPATDFPLSEITLWVEPINEKQYVILLPSEH